MSDEKIAEAFEHLMNREFGPEVYEIEKGMVKRFVDAVGEDNRRWVEQAPPTFPAAIVPTELVHELFNIDIPLKRMLNGASDLEHVKPIRTGDTIKVTSRLTRLRQVKGEEGPTLFMFTEMTYRNQHDEIVVKGKNTYIRY